ncbi:hypothetical protein BABINDRAFT_13102 [Babjeviella inositovora NRRL Y-12698]|uniref:21S rRNA pseudouridine(2819) synthase n=1 Tax=Babjeviella inositovora NRRL Y-12698 TaxID=984486 RepID=A0A1E3QTF4_9ASCO|nr:uncharacterized protein BABINDRAFT_13102 [Babjeviella inositovora NRRL Y-12698]ODQ80217.1 hypothetical protein BABINDRAFT_13102 [Babjeviella inositovora NRRL Y-12698]
MKWAQLKSLAPFQVLHDLLHFLIVNKPPGIVSQSGKQHHSRKLDEESVIYQLSKQLRRDYPESKEYSQLKTVHRLDRPVTGAMVIAKTKIGAQNFSKNLQQGGNKGFLIKRRYIALIQEPDLQYVYRNKCIHFTNKEKTQGIITTDAGKTSVTKFHALTDLEPQPLSGLAEYFNRVPRIPVLLELVSGRKHQIREHLQEAFRQPVLNDMEYDADPLHIDFNQIALHSLYVKTKVGMAMNEIIAPMCYGQGLWDGYLDQEGNFLPEIVQAVREFEVPYIPPKEVEM